MSEENNADPVEPGEEVENSQQHAQPRASNLDLEVNNEPQENDQAEDHNPASVSVIVENNQVPQSMNPIIFIRRHPPPEPDDESDQNEVIVVQNEVVIENDPDGVEIVHADSSNNEVIQIDDEEQPAAAPPPNNPEKPSLKSPNSSSKKRKLEEDDLNTSADDEGAICNICFDNFYQGGDHRLTSLKCGHIFGYSCISRWISECPRNQKCCPQCKAKAQARDFRIIYATKLRAIDNLRELELESKLNNQIAENERLRVQIGIHKFELETQRKLSSKLSKELEECKTAYIQSSNRAQPQTKLVTYRLFMEKNIDLHKDGQCRVMTYGQQKRRLFVSQKSMQALFPGYGLRLIDTTIFKATTFIHVGPKTPKDLAFDVTEQLIATASGDNTCKVFHPMSMSAVQAFKPSESAVVWSCAFDKERENFLYVGANAGTGFIYDIRSPGISLQSFKAEVDLTPIIKISPVKYSRLFPLGGLLVCHMKTIWFYEFIDITHNMRPTKLNINGPFISMNYDEATEMILLNVRGSPSEYILSRLEKCGEAIFLTKLHNFYGSRDTSIMTKSTQIHKNDSTIVSYYNMDAKKLEIWESNAGVMQDIPISDIVTDICTMYLDKTGDNTCLAALSENKCRIYKVIPAENYLSHVAFRSMAK